MTAARSGATPRELADEIYHAWGAIRDAARAAGDLPVLPAGQVAILRRLVEQGATRPATLASDLGVARPTISNALRMLESERLVERLASKTDGRSVVVVATPLAGKVLEAFGRDRVRLVVEAYNLLSARERDALAAAVEPLRKLTALVRGSIVE